MQRKLQESISMSPKAIRLSSNTQFAAVPTFHEIMPKLEYLDLRGTNVTFSCVDILQRERTILKTVVEGEQSCPRFVQLNTSW